MDVGALLLSVRHDSSGAAPQLPNLGAAFNVPKSELNCSSSQSELNLIFFSTQFPNYSCSAAANQSHPFKQSVTQGSLAL